MTRRIIVLGDVMTDFVASIPHAPSAGSDTAARIRSHGGGSAANTAAWLADLRAPVTLVARVGADALGDAATAELHGAGVDMRVARDPAEATGICLVLVTPDGERTMVPDPGANAHLSAADVPADLLAPGSHLHVSGYALFRENSRAAARHAMTLARTAGATLSVDASSRVPLEDVGAARFLAWARPADVLFANADEAHVLTGARQPEAAARTLADAFGLAVVKAGADGAVVAAADGDTWRVAAHAVEARDTTGAGDAFAAGFLAAWWAGGTVPNALASATHTAARAVARSGGRP